FIVFSLCLIPFLLTLYGAFNNALGVNPVETMNRRMGDWALYFLLITLSVTPLKQLFGWFKLLQFRRMLGLYAFFYACVHFLTFIWFDHYFNWLEIIEDIIKRPFITIGFISLVLLFPLALTSNKFMIKKLKKNWLRLHQSIYLIAILVIIHFFWMVKADYYQPLIFAIILGLLLGYRLLKLYKK
ncbi:MAG: sulfoxide reductase heme-binding subunit YedZ, partial [Gammaproteobacteria bacterium]|nr:sulfoxide reductase heme-binding subunit YedZ [Gammaproteobacteria bacterium]